MPESRCHLLAPGVSFAHAVSRWILDTHAALAPDLSSLTLVVPQAALAASLRGALLEAAQGALLMPRVVTLADFAAPNRPPASPLACRLRLAEALSRFRFLFEGQTPLRTAEALYALFDELEREAVPLPADEAALEALLQQGYGAPHALPALSREAQIVHRLHQAFQQEIGSAAPAVGQRLALQQALQHWPTGAPLLWIGFDRLSASEAAALRLALATGRAQFITQGRLQGREGAAMRRLFAQLDAVPQQWPASESPLDTLLDAALAETGSASERARVLPRAAALPGDLAVVAAADPEHEAQCADLAVREALLAGAQRVVVVSNDRRLARRLRARLERARVPLADRGGWALSTSRAAATLDAWLACAEGDFPLRPLLALLKSGFLPAGADWAAVLEPRAVQATMAGGAEHWRGLMQGNEVARFAQLLHAARALPPLGGSQPAAAQVQGVLDSLQRLGLDTALAADPAGARVLACLHDLATALGGTALKLHWRAFRALLDSALEDASFTLHAPGPHRVQLLTLDQTQGLTADAVILTGATAALFGPRGTPFFNAGVRRELGLPGAAENQALGLHRLRQLLQSAPRVRLLFAPEQPGEEAQPLAALQALMAFAEAAGRPLPFDTALAQRAPRAEIADDSPLPGPGRRAAPAAAASLLARPLSAHGHQALIECPYLFHARYSLRLERLKEPDAPVDRSDYGERVHRILHAFESPLEGLPPPWQGPREARHQPEMAAHLRRIAAAVFAPDRAARPLARFWQQAFEAETPWLAQQLGSWPEASVRVEVELAALREGWMLRGRADRIDEEGTRGRVVDYKSGQSPSKGDLAAGEAVQLPHYALLTPGVTAVEYWNLRDAKTVGLADEDLDALLPGIEARLGVLATAIERGAGLPANGAAAQCARCEMRGVCRRDDWGRA